MPLWDYKCKECGHECEEFTHTNEPLTKCPSCGKDSLEKVFNQVPTYREKDFYTKGGRDALIYKDLNKKYKKMAKGINKRNGFME